MVRTIETNQNAASERETSLANLVCSMRLLTSQSPLGFNAGDANLYRYVGNSPTNATDPNGLQEQELGGTKYDLPKCENLSRIFSPDPKEKSLKDVPFCRKNDLPGLPNDTKTEPISGGRGWSGVLPDGIYIGPDGCGPCVGVVLVPPKPGMPMYVLHFTSQQGVDAGFKEVGVLVVAGYDGLDSSLRVRWEIKPGYKAILCGAEQNPDKGIEAQRLHTLEDVKKWLGRWGIPIDKYILAPGFAVDKNGKVYWNTQVGTPLGRYEK